MIKGYLENDFQHVSSSILKGENEQFPNHVSLRIPPEQPDAGSTKVFLEQTKALFFVDSFEGIQGYREVKFFSSTPEVEGLWVRVTFHDSETIEGIIHNSIPFVTNPGFFMKPPDPHSNNKMIYVVKNSMREFRVLGVQIDY